ncbi:hypothetical protein D9M71_694570 [compost metagenome]
MGTVQALVDVGPGEVVLHGRRAEQQDPLGVLQGGQGLAGLHVQHAQVARQALDHFLGAGGPQMVGLEFGLRAEYP